MDEDLTDQERNLLLHAAAGQSFMLQYTCRGCNHDVFSTRPVELWCEPCRRKLVGTDIV